MPDHKALFAFAEIDDADALERALAKNSVTWRIRNEAGESLFLFCTFRGRNRCVELLKRRGDLSLHEAALAGVLDRVETLVASAPSMIDLLSPDGWTALHLACFVGNDAVILRLLDLGADAHIMSRALEQNLPIHAAAAGRRIGQSAFRKLIAATGPDALQKQGYTALMIAAGNGFREAVDALLTAGANLQIRTPEGKTAADFARERGFAEIAMRL